MPKALTFEAKDVAGFTLSEEGVWESRLLIDRENTGADSVLMTHFTVKPGQVMGEAVRHPEPYNEIYYVLTGEGVVHVDEPSQRWKLSPGVVVFIPAGTKHRVENTGTEYLEFLTVMPGPLREGVNPVYDGRRRAWGTTFKLGSTYVQQA